METTEKKINDLKEALELIQRAYYNQNNASCILHKYFTIDIHTDYEINEFYKIWTVDTSSKLYIVENKIKELIKKLENQ